MIHKFTQGSEEWFDYRMGKVTASHIIDIMPGKRVVYRKERDNYMCALAIEALTGISQETYKNGSMEHGIETEPFARSAYEALNETMIQEVGFIDHHTIDNTGASPDGLIYDGKKLVGGIEIKCPNTATHIDTLKTGKVKPDYILQMNYCMVCAEVEWWDFISFDDRLPDNARLYVKRIRKDKELCLQIENEVKKFQNELSELVKYLREYK